MELPRIPADALGGKRRARCVNYRHVIDSLRRKPRAFLQCQWRDQLLPNDNYRRLWVQLREQFSSDEAARLMVESLYLAAKLDKERAIEQWLTQQLRQGTLTLSRLQQSFAIPPGQRWEKSLIQQHSLSHYDQLLHYEFSPERHRNPTDFAQSPPITSDRTTLVGS